MRDNVKAADVANAVRMGRGYYQSAAFLVVEGADDRAFFARHTSNRSCRIEVGHGRDRVIEAIAILESQAVPGVLGICDADFSLLDGDPPRSANLLRTDCHDVECMLMRSPALAHVCGELVDADKFAAFESDRKSLTACLLSLGAHLGFLRWASHRHQWKLRFGGLDFSSFVGEKRFVLDREALLQAVRGQQGDRCGSPPSVEEMDRALSDLQKLEPDLWQVCCGHDLVELLSVALRRAIGSHNKADVLPARLERMLRLAYDGSYFLHTEIYRQMVAWQSTNAPFRLFADGG